MGFARHPGSIILRPTKDYGAKEQLTRRIVAVAAHLQVKVRLGEAWLPSCRSSENWRAQNRPRAHLSK
jgi:hypothetical protein